MTKSISEIIATKIGYDYFNEKMTKKAIGEKYNLSIYYVNYALNICLSKSLVERYD